MGFTVIELWLTPPVGWTYNKARLKMLGKQNCRAILPPLFVKTLGPTPPLMTAALV